MHFSNLVLPTAAENLALEEAWLDMAEDGEWSSEILRLWEPSEPMVVVGRGSRIAEEVNLAAARQAGVPVLRRSSGGAAIVAGPGCLMYAVLLSYEQRPHLRSLDQAHQLVMSQLVEAIGPLTLQLAWQGTCDLVVPHRSTTSESAARKVGGNSLRCRREWLLYHGTLLLSMDLSLIDRFLLHPPREPEYRQSRPHAEFVANLHLPTQPLADRLIAQWHADHNLTPPVPRERIDRLVAERYGNDAWNLQR